MPGKQQILLCISLYLVISCVGQNVNKNDNIHQSRGTTSKLNIDVYYESLCPDSHEFISNQLNPNWKDIAEYVNIRFIPFGKSASLDNGTKFICQHGSAECKGNRIMSCALSRISNQTLQVKYVTCFMEVYKYARFDANEFGHKCAEVLGCDSNEIMENCYLTKEGTQRQLDAEIKTNKVRPTFVPTIVYNGAFNQRLQDASLDNFGDVVCKLIRHTNPEACKYRSIITI